MDARTSMVMALIKFAINTGAEVPTVPDLAASVNLSPSRLRHLFKVNAGISLRRYLERIRMERAEVLLMTTFLSVKQIAAACGYRSSASLVRAFRQAVGQSPGKYRRQDVHPGRADRAVSQAHRFR